ncbi:hypothetical protein AGMMS4956_00210 [Bacteroidia bacterium]|nr:hypothetical protein AGMMS4956_00210 [Bacteroidia bacterium]
MKKILVCLLIWAPLQMVAQVEFLEPDSKVRPNSTAELWQHMNVFREYDSTDLVVQSWPVIEAYKKYVGQQLFLLAYNPKGSKVWKTTDGFGNEKVWDKSDVLLLDNTTREGTVNYLPYKRNVREQIAKRYYTVVDVVSYLDTTGAPKTIFKNTKQLGYRTYTFPSAANSNALASVPSDVPCFVLVEQTSGDTCYTAHPERFIIAGAFTKIQNQHLGTTFFLWDKVKGEKIVEEWSIIKVAIATRSFSGYPTYENKPTISFIIQNVKTGVQKALPLVEFLNMRWWEEVVAPVDNNEPSLISVVPLEKTITRRGKRNVAEE